MAGMQDPGRPVLFLDIDNCLYPLSLGIYKMMKSRIYAYGQEIGLDNGSVEETCAEYLKDYGLAVRGLIKHYNIDPASFNEKVDGSLPIEDIIKPNPLLRVMIESTTARVWAFTNAGLDHARRVLSCLGVEDLFEGVTFCDYTEPNFPCKPERRAYEKAMLEAGVSDVHLCYFADDSLNNVQAALDLGWTAVHVSEQRTDCGMGIDVGDKNDVRCCHISTITELPQALPFLFEQKQ
ncbi:suppressor of deletion of TFIIS [Coemansia sp. RSA 1813]|nr:putative suppressor of disruption of TFIIS [Coemansia sp. RSA 1646]KAJ1773218.1 suppressor of deletion of TFIIS [Coemansia sp. RSA 1843]KAJ2092686.1 suppressor of deletion of TFIIS [Coemansia sp. RSA 986]KAJ2217817.1 suppressor of deletion of TFIIS [Coemansia sp. RSA 487]KAJ2572948.1 suppressor of deletion of TFIIS [Coemansia sp. RSA 1813]